MIAALASSTGNILENVSLIESLTKTKVKSAEIEKALAASARASEELDRQRDVYRPFALAGSKLFFLIQVRRPPCCGGVCSCCTCDGAPTSLTPFHVKNMYRTYGMWSTCTSFR